MKKKDINIYIKFYEERYSYSSIVDNNAFKSYINILKKNILIDYEKQKDYQLLPINLKYNTDYNSFYDYFNFYFNDFGEKINVYIKKLYGEAEFYECNDSIDVKSPKILTTPISNCKNKKSIFNRILFLENSKLFSGYLGHDAHFYIYMEDNNQNKIIKMHQLRSQLNSAA